MKTSILTLPIFCSACFVAIAPLSSAAIADEENAFLKRSQMTRSVWQTIKTTNKTKQGLEFAEAQSELRKKNGFGLKSSQGVESYIAARIAYLTEEPLHRDTLAPEHSEAMLVEDIAILMGTGSNLIEIRRLYEQALADLLPLSRWNRIAASTSDFVISSLNLPRIPNFDRAALEAIASEFERSGIADLALCARLEAVYSTYPPSWPGGDYEGNWLSEVTAESWRKVAESARRAGREEIGKEYLFKAAVFGAENSPMESAKTLAKWLAEKTSKVALEPVSEKVRRDALTKAVRLYVDINAHPRALQLLDDYPDAFEDVIKLRKNIEGQWAAIVKDASRSTTKMTMYGLEVYPNGDPSKVRIPWAFSDEAIRKARLRITTADPAPTSKSTPARSFTQDSVPASAPQQLPSSTPNNGK